MSVVDSDFELNDLSSFPMNVIVHLMTQTVIVLARMAAYQAAAYASLATTRLNVRG